MYLTQDIAGAGEESNASLGVGRKKDDRRTGRKERGQIHLTKEEDLPDQLDFAQGLDLLSSCRHSSDSTEVVCFAAPSNPSVCLVPSNYPRMSSNHIKMRLPLPPPLDLVIGSINNALFTAPILFDNTSARQFDLTLVTLSRSDPRAQLPHLI